MLSLHGLVSILMLTSVTSWSASPVIDDKDLVEHSDYGFKVGGFLDLSQQTSFKGEIDATGKFVELSRESALATVGFSAFGRMCLTVQVGTGSSKGVIASALVSPDVKPRMEFSTKPALVWGGKLGVQLYSEGCIKAMGCARYTQSSMPVKMISGHLSRRLFQLVPSFDTANHRLGLYLVPDAASENYVNPTQAFTADAVMLSLPHVMYDPASVTLDFSQYELGLLFGYGQQHMMYVGAKVIGGVSTLNIPTSNVTNAIGQDAGTIFQALLGLPATVAKMEATRSCYIAPIVGFCLHGKGVTVDVSTSWLAQTDLSVKASVAF